MVQIERRVLPGAELRAAGGRRIVGYAAVFNSLSEDLGGFREMILPGTFDRALREKQDIRALWNHDDGVILGRTKSGTLKLSTDQRGLRAEIDAPDTVSADEVLTLIRRGDVAGMSFAFRTVTDDWRTQDGQLIRELRDVDLVEVSPCGFPAYTETQVSARALELARAPRSGPAPSSARSLAELELELRGRS